MYVTAFNRVQDESELRAMVAAVGAAELVTVGEDGYPLATRLPVTWTGGRVTAHMARPNPHWRAIADGSPALLVCSGPQAYVTPSWYASKREHGRVVPTWNYTSVQLRGTATVRDDADWLRDQVTALTDRHERGRPAPWRPNDAPEPFLAGQLRGIVGIEIQVESAEGKAKLSQNRSEADIAGVVDGLAAEDPARAPGAAAVAAAMRPGADDR